MFISSNYFIGLVIHYMSHYKNNMTEEVGILYKRLFSMLNVPPRDKVYIILLTLVS